MNLSYTIIVFVSLLILTISLLLSRVYSSRKEKNKISYEDLKMRYEVGLALFYYTISWVYFTHSYSVDSINRYTGTLISIFALIIVYFVLLRVYRFMNRPNQE